MPRGRPLAPLTLDDAQRAPRQGVARARPPCRMAWRCGPA